MNTDVAKEIQICTQRCIQELNSMLLHSKPNVSSEEFEKLRVYTAQAMGQIVELENVCLYAEHPDLKPY